MKLAQEGPGRVEQMLLRGTSEVRLREKERGWRGSVHHACSEGSNYTQSPERPSRRLPVQSGLTTKQAIETSRTDIRQTNPYSFFCCCLSQVPFDRDSNGQLALCLEASHNRARIIHWRDETGKAITTSVQVGSVV